MRASGARLAAPLLPFKLRVVEVRLVPAAARRCVARLVRGLVGDDGGEIGRRYGGGRGEDGDQTKGKGRREHYREVGMPTGAAKTAIKPKERTGESIIGESIIVRLRAPKSRSRLLASQQVRV